MAIDGFAVLKHLGPGERATIMIVAADPPPPCSWRASATGARPSRQRLSDRTELTVVVLTFRAAVVFGSYGVKSAVLSVR